MAKATDAQIKQVQDAIAAGKTPDVAVRINFGDPEPIQKVHVGSTSTDTKSEGK